jgi:hypothetical protein
MSSRLRELADRWAVEAAEAATDIRCSALGQCAAELRAELDAEGWGPYTPGETVISLNGLYAVRPYGSRDNGLILRGTRVTDFGPVHILPLPEPPR